MSEKEFLKDYLVSRVISFGKTVSGYGKIYYQTNEDLIEPYIDIDFQNKDVLSVLGSGDHVFTSRLLESHRVDSFDFNRLAIYYFYLRVWSIEYSRVLYPKIMDGDQTWLKSLLDIITPKNEQERRALLFFQKHVKENTNLSQLFFDLSCQPNGRTLYQKPSELDDCLSRTLTFYQMDLFHKFSLEATYDIVLISNILEWARKDPNKLKIACSNLAHVTKKDGVVVCSELLYKSSEEKQAEIDFFTPYFEYEKTSSGCMYIKKN